MNGTSRPIGCRCMALDDPDWHSKECWIRQTDALRQKLATTAYRLNVLEPEYTACRARAAAAEQHLKANDAALGLTGVESRPQAMYIRDLQNQLAHAEFDHDHYELVKQQLEAVKQEKQRNYDHYSDQLAHFEQQLAQVIAERNAAETRNENYRLKLHTCDQQLAHVTAENPTLRQQCLTVAQRFSAYLPEPLEPEDCDELMHYIEDMVQHER